MVYLPATPQPHRPPNSPDRTCAQAHCRWDDDYDVFPAIQHLLAGTAPRPQAHHQATEPQEPDHPMQPRSIFPAPTADQNAGHQQKEPKHAPTPPPPPPPQGHIRHTSRHPRPLHRRRAVLPIRPTRAPSGPRDSPGLEQEKGNDNEWGTGDDLLWENTSKGTMEQQPRLTPAARGHKAQPPRAPSFPQLETPPHHHPPPPHPKSASMDA